jgi:hypothetical protein
LLEFSEVKSEFLVESSLVIGEKFAKSGDPSITKVTRRSRMKSDVSACAVTQSN